MRMKTTTKLWASGVTSGVLAFGTLTMAAGYLMGDQEASMAVLIVMVAFAQCFGFIAAGSCLSAVIVRVLQADQRASAVLQEVERRFGAPARASGLRVVGRDT
ncbi:hypothetical protein [Micromonospora sp. NPDC005652]|uniref:hypothetical protein n=1 Tax=Micromonospora sp. NPDC005652 TaxID=3157046 RepID=UPI0033C484BD